MVRKIYLSSITVRAINMLTWRGIPLLLFILMIMVYFGREIPTNVNYPQLLLDPYIVQPFDDGNCLAGLTNLKLIHWPEIRYAPKPSGIRNANGTVEPLPPAFEPVMSSGQRELNKHLLRLFSNLMFKAGLGDRFMLYAGTLLGSYRHHDLIPWDDDSDIIADISARPAIQNLLQSLGSEYVLTKQRSRDKFCTKLTNTTDDVAASRKSSRYSWGWPYLDIGYYHSNLTTVCAADTPYGRRLCWPRHIVFPLRFRPFGRNWYPTPFNVLSFLRIAYGSTPDCKVFGYSHVLEGGGPHGKLLCEKLSEKYPFVQRDLSSIQIDTVNFHDISNDLVVVRESLVLALPDNKNQTIHTIELPAFRNECRTATYGLNERTLT